MLDAWIIEELRKQQEREQQRPELRIEIDPPMPEDRPREESPSEERGVIVIDLLG